MNDTIKYIVTLLLSPFAAHVETWKEKQLRMYPEDLREKVQGGFLDHHGNFHKE
jgi:hypothetical protein